MIALGMTFMVVSCFTYSMEEDKDKVLELIENVGHVVITTIICMTMIMFLSLMVV